MSNIFVIMTISLLLILIMIPLNQMAIYSPLNHLVIVIAYITALSALINNKLPKNIFIPLVLLLLWLVICLIIDGTSLVSNSNVIVSSVLFYMIPLAYVSYIPVKNNHRMTIYVLYIILSCLMIVFYFSSFSHDSVVNYGHNEGMKYISKNLTLGYNNSNETALILYFIICILSCSVLSVNSKLIKLISVILISILVVLLYKTNSRTCLITLIIVNLLYIFKYKTMKILKNKWVIRLIILLPLFFLFFYVILWVKYANSEFVFLGKPLFSGREVAYSELFINVILNPIFGNIGFFNFENSFNAYLTLILNIGFVGFLLFLIVIMKALTTLSNNINTKSQFYSFISLLSVFILSCTESAILAAGGYWYLFLTTLLVISNDNKKDNSNSNALLE